MHTSSKTHVVLWKDGDTTKKQYLIDLDLSKTIGDLKAELEISTRVPFARQSIKVMRSTETGERELSDDLNVHKAIGPLEVYIMREKKLKRNVRKKAVGTRRHLQGVAPPHSLSAYALYFRARYREDRAHSTFAEDQAEVNAFAASIAAEWKALSDADAEPWHAGAEKEKVLYQNRHRFCELSGDQLVGQKFSDDRENGRGPGRVVAMLEMNQEPHPDALAYHCLFDDMRQGGETLSLSELHARVCCDARAARRAAKKSYVVAMPGDEMTWRTIGPDYDREIPSLTPISGGRPVSRADMDRLKEATAPLRQESPAFREYSSMILLPRFRAAGLLGALKGVEDWPRFRPYWHRVRRRVCAHCFKRADLTEPRYLVCSGCGEARYCSEGCQRAHWAEHRKECPAGQPGWNAAVDSR